MLELLTVPTLAAASALIVSLILWWLFIDWVFHPRRTTSTRKSSSPENSNNSSKSKSNRHSDTKPSNDHTHSAQQPTSIKPAIDNSVARANDAQTTKPNTTNHADAAPKSSALNKSVKAVTTTPNTAVSRIGSTDSAANTHNKTDGSATFGAGGKTRIAAANKSAATGKALDVFNDSKSTLGTTSDKAIPSKADALLSTNEELINSAQRTTTNTTNPAPVSPKNTHSGSVAHTKSPTHGATNGQAGQSSQSIATQSGRPTEAPARKAHPHTAPDNAALKNAASGKEHRHSPKLSPTPTASEHSGTGTGAATVVPASDQTGTLKAKPGPAGNQTCTDKTMHVQTSGAKSLPAKPSPAKPSPAKPLAAHSKTTTQAPHDAQLAVLPVSEAKASGVQKAPATNPTISKEHKQVSIKKDHSTSDKVAGKTLKEKNPVQKNRTTKYQTAAKAQSPSVRNEASIQIQHPATNPKSSTSDIVNFDEKSDKAKINVSLSNPLKSRSAPDYKPKADTSGNVTQLTSISNRQVPRPTTIHDQSGNKADGNTTVGNSTGGKSSIEMAMERQSDAADLILQQKLNDKNTDLRAQLAASQRKIASLQSTLNNWQQKELVPQQSASSNATQQTANSRPSLLSKVRVLDPTES